MLFYTSYLSAGYAITDYTEKDTLKHVGMGLLVVFHTSLCCILFLFAQASFQNQANKSVRITTNATC